MFYLGNIFGLTTLSTYLKEVQNQNMAKNSKELKLVLSVRTFFLNVDDPTAIHTRRYQVCYI